MGRRADIPADTFELVAWAPPEFGNRSLQRKADGLAILHPRIADMLEAAPILVLADDLRALHDAAVEGVKLKEVMRRVGLPYPMRVIAPADVIHWRDIKGWRYSLLHAPPTEIAQLLAEFRDYQRDWLRRLGKIGARLSVRCGKARREKGAAAHWVARMSRHDLRPVYTVIDFMAENDFDWSWGLRRLMNEHDRWTDRINAVAMAEAIKERERLEAKAVARIGRAPVEGFLGALHPTHFRLMTSPEALAEEGRAMRHCVGSSYYRRSLRDGSSLFYRLENGAGPSTLQVRWNSRSGSYRHSQHCGPCNARPGAGHAVAARQLVSLVNDYGAWAEQSGAVAETCAPPTHNQKRG